MITMHVVIFLMWVCYGYELYWKFHDKIREEKERDELYQRAKDAMDQYKGLK